MPLANTIKLVDKDTQCEVYLYGLYPRAAARHARTLINLVKPNLLVLDDIDLASNGQAYDPGLQFLEPHQLKTKLQGMQYATKHAVFAAMQEARVAGCGVALFRPSPVPDLPTPVLQSCMQHIMQIPFPLAPFDNLIHAVTHGERDLELYRTLCNACTQVPAGSRVACIVGLESLPTLQTLWLAGDKGAKVDYGGIPELTTRLAPKKKFDLIDWVLGADKDDAQKADADGPKADPNFLLAVAASQRPMTQRAILHSIPGSTPRQEYPFLHRNVEGLKAEISVPNDEAEAEFWQEVNAVRAAVDAGPQAYEPTFITAAWKNIMYIYANAILSKQGHASLEYPGVREVFHWSDASSHSGSGVA